MDSGGGPKGARVPGSNFLIYIYIYIYSYYIFHFRLRLVEYKIFFECKIFAGKENIFKYLVVL